ncbi:MAG: carboxylating nicotinate-nucleotide diphosphorylase [Thermodesulfobacteriota bacterium]
MDKNKLCSLIRTFLDEDIGRGDLTSETIFPPTVMGTAALRSRQDCILAGLDIAAEVFHVQNPAIVVSDRLKDGHQVRKGDLLCHLEGPVVDLLKGERVALNLLQRLSGIATLTAAFVEQVKLYPVRITDTRKTTPGLRLLEKYGVRAGGGYNHRFGLDDGVMVKDNHIAACGSISKAVGQLRETVPHTIRIEVETDTLDQVRECVECGVDIIMLDNMTPVLMKEAVSLIDSRALIEASGGVTLETVRGIAACGVDIISIGALTHSAPSCDIGMDWL